MTSNGLTVCNNCYNRQIKDDSPPPPIFPYWFDGIKNLDNSEFLLVCGNVRQNLLCSANIKTEQAISYFRISGCFRVSNQLRD